MQFLYFPDSLLALCQSVYAFIHLPIMCIKCSFFISFENLPWLPVAHALIEDIRKHAHVILNSRVYIPYALVHTYIHVCIYCIVRLLVKRPIHHAQLANDAADYYLLSFPSSNFPFIIFLFEINAQNSHEVVMAFAWMFDTRVYGKKETLYCARFMYADNWHPSHQLFSKKFK